MTGEIVSVPNEGINEEQYEQEKDVRVLPQNTEPESYYKLRFINPDDRTPPFAIEFSSCLESNEDQEEQTLIFSLRGPQSTKVLRTLYFNDAGFLISDQVGVLPGKPWVRPEAPIEIGYIVAVHPYDSEFADLARRYQEANH